MLSGSLFPQATSTTSSVFLHHSKGVIKVFPY